MAVITFDGHIMGASFASGDRIVAGRWCRSPFGAFADVMWCRPDGRRVLLAPDERVRDFVAGHYAFDELAIDDIRVERPGDGRIEATAGPVRLVLRARPPGPASTLLAMRPRRLRTWRPWISLEDLALRPLVQPLFAAARVRTIGVTFAGAREWYAIHDLREADAEAAVDGVDLGAPAACEPAGFGFSEFPSQPAIVRVTSMFAEVAPRAAAAAALSG
jgi:hypothetical protein